MQVDIRTAEFWSYGFDADLEYAFAGSKWAGKTRSGIGITVRAPGAFIVNAFGGTADYFEEKDAVAFRSRGANCWLESDKELKGRAMFALVATLFPDWLTQKGKFSPLEKTIVVSGPPRGLYSAGFWLPDALVQSGVTYVRLDRLIDFDAKEKDHGNYGLGRSDPSCYLAAQWAYFASHQRLASRAHRRTKFSAQSQTFRR